MRISIPIYELSYPIKHHGFTMRNIFTLALVYIFALHANALGQHREPERPLDCMLECRELFELLSNVDAEASINSVRSSLGAPSKVFRWGSKEGRFYLFQSQEVRLYLSFYRGRLVQVAGFGEPKLLPIPFGNHGLLSDWSLEKAAACSGGKREGEYVIEGDARYAYFETDYCPNNFTLYFQSSLDWNCSASVLDDPLHRDLGCENSNEILPIGFVVYLGGPSDVRAPSPIACYYWGGGECGE